MKSNFLKRRHAIACLLLFLGSLSNASMSALPSGKLEGFSIKECNKVICYTISGQIGFTSKMGDIFSSENTSVVVINKNTQTIQNFSCDEFKLEVSDGIGTCADNKLLKSTEFNFSINKIKTLNFL